MGTNTKQLQQEIKWLLERLGWSQKRLAREIYVATYDDDDFDEIKKIEERVKKELQRNSTPEARLAEYLKVISQHPECEKLCIVTPFHYNKGVLSKEMLESMTDISKEITKKLRDDL